MKNLAKIILVVFLMAFMSSCTKTEEEDISGITQLEINNAIDQMKSLGDQKGKIVYFNVGNLLKEDYQNYFEVVEDSKKVLDFSSGSDTSLQRAGDNYTVTCSWGNGESEVTECGSNVGCAGKATWECLENGGCATICNAKIMYIPSNITLSKDEKKEAIGKVLQQVSEFGRSKNQSLSFNIAYNSLGEYWLSKPSEIIDINRMSASMGKYQVDCYGSDGEVMWSDSYDDKDSASIGILKCTDEDKGCAEICEIQARFFFSENG